MLLLHGVLHLAGFDHETDTGEMAAREADLREKLGLTAGLIARASGASAKGKDKQKQRLTTGILRSAQNDTSKKVAETSKRVAGSQNTFASKRVRV